MTTPTPPRSGGTETPSASRPAAAAAPTSSSESSSKTVTRRSTRWSPTTWSRLDCSETCPWPSRRSPAFTARRWKVAADDLKVQLQGAESYDVGDEIWQESLTEAILAEAETIAG